MSYLLPNLQSGWAVDQAILHEEERLVVIRFGNEWDKTCMAMDEVLYRIAEKVKNFAVIYVCSLKAAKDLANLYELYDPMCLMFFFRNKHMQIDTGTGNNNKITFVVDQQDLIDIIETTYLAAKRGKGLAYAPKEYSTKHRY
eukprot:TRINITY_DN85421_c0_g1_i1.p1 TRINITY_DN85421_c0_g1~~TRINITY_DN85421_c0_g1_i1.p1  ORF type:complete len:142 (+),score=46.92 TRINITY_DN85421_c0_g1_i1:40-465(+)